MKNKVRTAAGTSPNPTGSPFGTAMKFFKNKGVTLWLDFAVCLLCLGAVIALFVTNGVRGYALDGLTLACGILTLLFALGGTVASLFFRPDHLLTVGLKFVSLVLAAITLSKIILSRVVLVSALFTWDPHNALGWSALYSSIATLVLFLLAIVVLIVCAFLARPRRTD